MSAASDDSVALTEDDVDTMISAIRAGSAASFALLVISAVSLIHGSFAMDPHLNPIVGAFVIGEMLVYATSAVLIWHLSRYGAVLLYAFCLGKMAMLLVGHDYVGLSVGALLLFVIHRSGLNAFRLHRLLRAARTAQAELHG